MKIEKTELKPFEPAFEFYCFKNCYLQWLGMYGVRNGFYHLDCTLDWKFAESEEDTYGYQFSTSDIYCSVLPSHKEKIKMFDQTNWSTEQIWDENNRLLKEGVPFVAAVDVFELPYTPYYQKKHSYHALLVMGINENDQYDVIDWYPPWFFHGQISKTELDRARSSENTVDGLLSGNPIRYLWTELEQKGWHTNDKHLIAEALKISVDRFYGTDDSGKLSDGSYTGAKALSALNKTITANMESESDPEAVSRFLQDLHGKLYFVPNRKKLLHNYLEHAYREYGFLKFPRMIDTVQDSISEWKKLLNITIKAGMSPTEENRKRVADMVESLIFKEKDINYLMYDSLATI